MKRNQWIIDEVNRARKRGIPVDVRGILYTSGNSKKLMRVLEKGSYMLDYEGDPLGRIIALHVDPVGPSEPPVYKSLRISK